MYVTKTHKPITLDTEAAPAGHPHGHTHDMVHVCVHVCVHVYMFTHTHITLDTHLSRFLSRNTRDWQ